MADFTIRLKDILNVQTPQDHDPVLIGLDDYHIWDEGYRHQLNTKIVKRFWNREIAHETVEEFRFRMDTVMGEIMPYYNRLYKTTFEFDPFETVNVTMDNDASSKMTGTMDGDTTGTTTATTTATESSESDSDQTSDSEAVAVASEYPQTRIVDDEHYATSSNESKSASTSESKATSTGESEQTSDGETQSQTTQNTNQDQQSKQTQHTQGFQGNKAQLIQEYRDTLIGVDNQILAELEILFMGLWENETTYNRLTTDHIAPYYF